MNCGEKTQKNAGSGCGPAKFQEMFQKMTECCPPECKTMMETFMGTWGADKKQENGTERKEDDASRT